MYGKNSQEQKANPQWLISYENGFAFGNKLCSILEHLHVSNWNIKHCWNEFFHLQIIDNEMFMLVEYFLI